MGQKSSRQDEPSQKTTRSKSPIQTLRDWAKANDPRTPAQSLVEYPDATAMSTNTVDGESISRPARGAENDLVVVEGVNRETSVVRVISPEPAVVIEQRERSESRAALAPGTKQGDEVVVIQKTAKRDSIARIASDAMPIPKPDGEVENPTVVITSKDSTAHLENAEPVVVVENKEVNVQEASLSPCPQTGEQVVVVKDVSRKRSAARLAAIGTKITAPPEGEKAAVVEKTERRDSKARLASSVEGAKKGDEVVVVESKEHEVSKAKLNCDGKSTCSTKAAGPCDGKTSCNVQTAGPGDPIKDASEQQPGKEEERKAAGAGGPEDSDTVPHVPTSGGTDEWQWTRATPPPTSQAPKDSSAPSAPPCPSFGRLEIRKFPTPWPKIEVELPPTKRIRPNPTQKTETANLGALEAVFGEVFRDK